MDKVGEILSGAVALIVSIGVVVILFKASTFIAALSDRPGEKKEENKL